MVSFLSLSAASVGALALVLSFRPGSPGWMGPSLIGLSMVLALAALLRELVPSAFEPWTSDDVVDDDDEDVRLEVGSRSTLRALASYVARFRKRRRP